MNGGEDPSKAGAEVEAETDVNGGVAAAALPKNRAL